MNSYFDHHGDSLQFHYRCLDHVLLNGLIQPLQQPERVVGFFNTYRRLYPVSRHVLRGIAEQFQQWLKGWTERETFQWWRYPGGVGVTRSLTLTSWARSRSRLSSSSKRGSWLAS